MRHQEMVLENEVIAWSHLQKIFGSEGDQESKRKCPIVTPLL
ncbi:hypothetical protein [Sphingobacterium lumbrici]|nr:hypothetical protein [Sphingobacterium lumbrici]